MHDEMRLLVEFINDATELIDKISRERIFRRIFRGTNTGQVTQLLKTDETSLPTTLYF